MGTSQTAPVYLPPDNGAALWLLNRRHENFGTRFRAVSIPLLFVLLLISCTPRALSQAAGAAELGGTLIALQQLKATMESAIGTADQATAAKIRQAEIAVDATIAQIKGVMDHGYGLINNTRDQVMGNVATTLIGT
jgi:hypothetical protein